MKTIFLLHANTQINIHEKINSRGNKEQAALNPYFKKFDTIWGGGSAKSKRKGTWISYNEHLTAKTFCTHNYFEFY